MPARHALLKMRLVRQMAVLGRRISAVSAELIILVLLIATALAFDFTNGFHDTGNAMATSIATRALKPKTAVLLAGVLNLVGAFLSDRKSTRLNSSHIQKSRMPSSA